MKLLIAIVMSLMLLCVPGCGGDTHESLATESMPVMRELVDTLGTVKDEASAKAAKPKLEAIAKQLKDLEARRNKLPAPTEAELKGMIDKHGKEMEELQQKLITTGLAIQFDPKIQAVLGDIDFKMK